MEHIPRTHKESSMKELWARLLLSMQTGGTRPNWIIFDRYVETTVARNSPRETNELSALTRTPFIFLLKWRECKYIVAKRKTHHHKNALEIVFWEHGIFIALSERNSLLVPIWATAFCDVRFFVASITFPISAFCTRWVPVECILARSFSFGRGGLLIRFVGQEHVCRIKPRQHVS